MDKALFEKFNEMFEGASLAKDIADINSDKVERKEVPYGDYEVKIVKLELGEHEFDDEKKGFAEAKVWFKIISEGEYEGQMLFMNKTLMSVKGQRATAFLTRKFNEFLESLETDIPVVFENWVQYGALIDEIFNSIDGRGEYQLAFFDNRGYKDYEIVKRFQ